MGHGDGNNQDVVTLSDGQNPINDRPSPENTLTACGNPSRLGIFIGIIIIITITARRHPPQGAKRSVIDSGQHAVPALVDDAVITIDAGRWTSVCQTVTNRTGTAGEYGRYAGFPVRPDSHVDDGLTGVWVPARSCRRARTRAGDQDGAFLVLLTDVQGES